MLLTDSTWLKAQELTGGIKATILGLTIEEWDGLPDSKAKVSLTSPESTETIMGLEAGQSRVQCAGNSKPFEDKFAKEESLLYVAFHQSIWDLPRVQSGARYGSKLPGSRDRDCRSGRWD